MNLKTKLLADTRDSRLSCGIPPLRRILKNENNGRKLKNKITRTHLFALGLTPFVPFNCDGLAFMVHTANNRGMYPA